MGGLPLRIRSNQSQLLPIDPQDLAAAKTEEITQQLKLSTNDT